MKYLMAMDQGTTSSRCVLFGLDGQIVSAAHKELEQVYPRVGWVEHDPMEIWSSQVGVCHEALAKVGATGRDVLALGITNQRETTIVWDRKTGRPVYNAIVWQCRRTAEYCDELCAKGFGEKIRAKTGLVPDAYFSATKLKWILDNVEGSRERGRKGELLFGTVDAWLVWRLTNGRAHATDVSNASRTMMYNIHKLEWDQDILEELDIPRAMLPEVMPSSCVYGVTEMFEGEIKIAGTAGDQQAALFGQGCFDEGMVKNTYGTGCFILMNTAGKAVESRHKLLTTIAWDIGQGAVYALEGSVFSAGAAVQWLRDGLRIIDSAELTEYYANKVADTNGVYVVPAFTGLGAPYWDPYARGTIVGLTRGASKEHVIRATLESMAYQSRDVIKAMGLDYAPELPVPVPGLRTEVALKVDGGASANNFLMQFQADILDVEVARPEIIESTALGAARLAALGAGLYEGIAEIKALPVKHRVFTPNMDAALREAKVRDWRKAVESAKGWARE
ncbi:MAG: glycerol kinase GlpK [Clostridiales bacterium]|jgi:glycerol kinase|nr:glycerol kinase GlpK [Clostridiales bacterium]